MSANNMRDPLPWSQFVSRPKIKGKPLDEQRRLYDIERQRIMKQQLFNQVQQASRNSTN